MRFDIGDDRRHFAAAIDALTAAADMPAVVRAWARGDRTPGSAVVSSLADMGVTGLLVDESAGGVGGDTIDVMVALERLGHACCPGPMVDTVAVAPGLLGAEAAVSGDMISVASSVLMPRAVDADVCSIVLTMDDSRAAIGVARSPKQSVDPARTLFDVDVHTPLDATAEQVRLAHELGSLGTAAYLLGAGTRLLEMSVAHAGLRTQFGRPIGSFQAVAHMLADSMIGLELARPLVLGAALALDTESADVVCDVSAARVSCGDAAYRAARTALQVHGALGYTAECDVSLYLTRIRAMSTSWGTPAWHRRRIANALTAGHLSGDRG